MMKINYIREVITSLLFLSFFVPANGQVTYIAHRGASFLAPENTVSSAKLAWKLGVDAVEADIHLSKDNKIMVIHDSNTKRTTGQDFKVKETNSETLRKLDAGSIKDEKYKGEKIPFLSEIIKTVPPGKKLVIELKSRNDVFPELKKAVRKCRKQMILISFDKPTIISAKQLFPEIPCYWLCGNKEALMSNIKSIADAGLEGVDVDYSIVDEKMMEMTKKLKLDVVVYTLDDPVVAKRLIGYGVKGITSNRADWIKKQVNSSSE